VVLPVREIGDVIFADFFRQIFAGVRVEALPFFQRRVIRQRDGKKFAPPFAYWTKPICNLFVQKLKTNGNEKA